MGEELFRTWKEPTPEALASAIARVDRMVGGAEPNDLIDTGIAIHLRMREQEGAPFSRDDRSALVKAVERVASLDEEAPKCHITSLAAARMITFDVQLQREARMIDSGDVLDRYDFLDPAETRARGVYWDTVPNVRDVLIGENAEGISAIARGDLHELSGFANEALKAGIEHMRFGGGSAVSIAALKGAGLIDAERAARATAMGTKLDREERSAISNIDGDRERADLKSIGAFRSYGEQREGRFESTSIARRLMDSLKNRYMHPERTASPEVVDRARLDASFPDPQTPQGVAVKEAIRTLQDAGLGFAVERPAFGMALERGLREEGVVSAAGMARQIAFDVAVQMDARRLLKTCEMRAAGRRLAPAAPEGPAARFIVSSGRANMTDSPRDLEDLRAIVSGDRSKLSFDYANHLRASSERAWVQGAKEDRRLGRAVELVVGGHVMVPDPKAEGTSRFAVIPAPRKDASPPSKANAQLRIDALTKGPRQPAGDWIAQMARSGSQER